MYDHHDADGFITLFGLPLKVRAMKLAEVKNNQSQNGRLKCPGKLSGSPGSFIISSSKNERIFYHELTENAS